MEQTREPVPKDLIISRQAPEPVDSDHADLNIPVDRVTSGPVPPNRLVVIGDSLCHGFKSFAIHDTDISWPAVIAYELGWDEHFRRPHYPGPDICPGLPLNIEALVRALEKNVTSLPLNLASEIGTVVSVLVHMKAYWELGDGNKDPEEGRFNHNLAVWGWDIGDATKKSLGWCQDRIGGGWRRELADKAHPFVTHPQERSAVRSLWGTGLPPHEITQVSAARALGDEGDGPHGIETLVIELGANNALGAVVSLQVKWSGEGYDDLSEKARLGYTVWRPDHFLIEFEKLVAEVMTIKARHVIWCTVPHVTIAPLLRGVGEKPAFSPYFARYTRPWIKDQDFDAVFHPCLTGDEVRAIDSAIDQYNYYIKRAVIAARADTSDPRDWLLFDFCGLLDRMAYKRYLASPQSRPTWWHSLDLPYESAPYELPQLLKDLSPWPDTRFLSGDQFGRTAGGLVALDGVHPTTIGYGIAAQEMIRIMAKAGVIFKENQDVASKPWIDAYWTRLVECDELIKDPPASLAESLELIGILNEQFDIYRHLRRQSPK